MGTAANVIGRIRKPTEGIDLSAVSNEENFTLTQQLEQLIAQGASLSEIHRLGHSFQVGTTTAVAAVVAMPASTVHGFSIYNNEPEGGKSYVLDWLGCSNVVTTTGIACQGQMLGLIGQVPEVAPAFIAAPAIKKMNGMSGGAGGTVDSRARAVLTGTALPATTGVAADWFPCGPCFNKIGVAALTTPAGYGSQWYADGRIIIPPKRYFSMHVIANVVGETFQMWVAWHEKKFDLA